jgi:predicted ATPase
VGATYARALELSRRFASRDIFVILSGAWVFRAVRGDLQSALQVSAEFLTLAEKEPTPHLMLAGNFLVGCTLFHLGQLPQSLHHMNEAFRMVGGPNDSMLDLFAGPNLEVFCRAYLAHLAWQSGDEEQSVTHAEIAIEVARRLDHPFSRGIALAYAAMLDVFRENSQAAFEHAREAVELCGRYGFTYYLAMAGVLLGWARAAQGDAAGGLDEMRSALAEMRRLGAELRLPFYLKLLAQILGRSGQVREALAELSTAFAIESKNGEAWALPELHRAEAEVLAAEGRVEQSKSSLANGLKAARQCGSLALQTKLSVLLDGTAGNTFSERLQNAAHGRV